MRLFPLHSHKHTHSQTQTHTPTQKVIACEDNLLGSRLMAQTLAHELVHAYDQCRAKINFNSCYHYACTEVGRAVDYLCVCVCVLVWCGVCVCACVCWGYVLDERGRRRRQARGDGVGLVPGAHAV